MDYAIELDQVSKAYPSSGFRLEDITLALPSGCILGLVGENGAGKTTLIGCLLNTLRRDSGQVRLLGREPSDSDTALREELGVVYDGQNFPSYLTPEQLSRILAGAYRRWDQELFYQQLRELRLPQRQKLGEYSRGMTMQLAIAAAIAHHPRLLILDEATSGLDPVTRDDMLDIFLAFVGQEDHSILLSSHITSDLEKVADYIALLHQGRLLLTETKDKLRYDYAVLRCGESQLSAIDPADILAVRRREHQTDVLTADGAAARRKYPHLVIDQAALDEIMLLLLKGERK